MEKIRLSAVSYTNTMPFLHGLRDSAVLEQVDMSLDIPSACARKLISGEADLGIVPVAALPEIANYQIVTDFCLGADGAVDSVFIFSKKPVTEIRTLRLDSHSRTSNALARVLLQFYWETDVEIVDSDEADAFVQIGDRTFGKKEQAPYHYDLAAHWKAFQGLPFVFAVWVANKPLPEPFIQQFNEALAKGVAQRVAVAEGIEKRPDFDYVHYLTENIDYRLDAEKRKAIELFLGFVEAIGAVAHP